MSATHMTSEHSQSGVLHCKRCNTSLPPGATFCGNCGERVEKKTSSPSAQKYKAIAERYRITSLVQRRSMTQLVRALDTQQQRSVIILDIDMSSLDATAQTQTSAALQQEYDLLRQQSIAHIIPLIDMQSSTEHLYLIAKWHLQKTQGEQNTTQNQQHQTLQELLQSGIGLPEESVAIAWIHRLSKAIAHLHSHNITIGDLDPQTIFVSEDDYTGQPALMVSWLPPRIRPLFPPITTSQVTPFMAPEAIEGHTEARSDIYSLGAILYLLLTGVPPLTVAARAQKPLRAIHDLNPRISHNSETIVTQALALDASERYQSADELSEILFRLGANLNGHQPSRVPPARTPRAIEKPKGTKEETSITFPVDDNKSEEGQAPTEVAETDDATVSVVPLQARMARRYLSRIKTGKLGTADKSIREAFVDEGQQTSVEQTVEEEQSQSDKLPTAETAKKQPSQETMEQEGIQEPSPSKAISQTNVMKPSSQEALPHQSAHKPLSQKNIVEQQNQAKIATADTSQLSPAQQAVREKAANNIAEQHTVLLPHSPGETVASPEGLQLNNGSMPDPASSAPQEAENSLDSVVSRFKNIITGSLPAIPKTLLPKSILPNQPESEKSGKDASLLKRVQRFILGEPPHSTTAAALIETPMRIQPNQSYSIRINVMGRNTIKGSGEGSGLSALVEGDIVHIEVRSALYQNYAYIVQQTDVQLPAEGFVSEVTMPMQPLTSGPSGRRERLHIFFMDALRNPLYEKPFVIEIFISHLVHAGREGHNVLAIPL